MKHLVVLGGGPGGYAAAFEAVKQAKRAGLELRVTLIERTELGGTCLNVGCIPTKTILRTAHALQDVARLGEFAVQGVNADGAAVDLPALRTRKDKVVTELVGQVATAAKRLGITVIKGEGRLTKASPVITVEIASKEGECDPGVSQSSPVLAENSPPDCFPGARTQTCDALIIATGTVPMVLPALDTPCVWTSDDALKLKSIPESIIIVGGGVIGVEFACAYAAFGSKVSVVELAPSLLPAFDKRVCRTLAKALEEQGVELYLGNSVEVVSQESDGSCSAKLASGVELQAEVVMSAVGRTPNTKGFGFEECGLKFDRRALAVDKHFRTNLPQIYAVGDVIGGVMLAHAAEHEGTMAARNAVSELAAAEGLRFARPSSDPASPDYRLEIGSVRIPGCIYTTPEIATIGMSVDEAKAAGYAAVCGIAKYAGNGKALAEGESEGFVQLVANKENGQLLGAQIVGARAVELIAIIRPYLLNEISVSALADSVFAHPTLSEVIKAAAEATESKLA